MKSRSQLLAICLLLSTFAAGAVSRTVTAFSSFHVISPMDSSHTPYQCLVETYGAVVNSCDYTIEVAFTIPVDHAVVHTLKVQNFVGGFGPSGTVCTIWSYDGNGNGAAGTTAQFNPSGAETLTFKSIKFGNSISLLCDMPGYEGISSLSWNP